MLRLKKFWVILCCLMLVLCSGRLTNSWTISNELETIYLDFEIALRLLQEGYPILERNLTEAQQTLLGLRSELMKASEENESLKASLEEQRMLLESSRKELDKTKQHSFDLENTLKAAKETAEIDLKESVGKIESRTRLWRSLALIGGVVVAVETLVLIFR